MSKRNKIIYWASTALLALAMLATGILQLLRVDMEVEMLGALGYPVYFLTILGAWKILGVAAVLAPRLPLVKEWAYAGFFFTMSGAVFSHVGAGDPITKTLPGILLMVLIVLSWHFRPASRKITRVAA